MTDRVTVVLPALEDQELLARHLPPLLAELDARGKDEDVHLVDDTGRDVLSDWVRDQFPGRVRVLVREKNGGFGKSLRTGARLGMTEFLLALNPDVKVRPGFLQPLIDALEDRNVLAATPRILLDGDPDKIESHQALVVEDGRLVLVPRKPRRGTAINSIPFPIGGAMLVRRQEFLDEGGFDPLFEPFYMEDLDLGLTMWRRGGRVVEVPESVVEHHHMGTIGRVIPESLRLAAIERNRLLVHWKHLDQREDAQEHLAALWRDALDAGLAGRREELLWMALALQDLDRVTDSRRQVGQVRRGLAQTLIESDPTG
tara:strand:- start:7875 stop:8816 length:942 start_codon:yes stop_codon:yes gene_type:complete